MSVWKPRHVPQVFSQARLTFSHDEDMEVFLNGTLALYHKGYVTDYEAHRLSPEHLKSFRVGKNILAVHCHQTGGGQFIDVGLTYRRARPER